MKHGSFSCVMVECLVTFNQLNKAQRGSQLNEACLQQATCLVVSLTSGKCKVIVVGFWGNIWGLKLIAVTKEWQPWMRHPPVKANTLLNLPILSLKILLMEQKLITF